MPVILKRIFAAVGRNGTNNLNDRRVVMHLLNQVPASSGGPDTFFIESDPVSELIPVIESFQRRNVGRADGRVDVEGRTLRLLREFDSDPGGPISLPTVRSGKKGAGSGKKRRFG